MSQLKYKAMWLFLGYAMVLFVIHASLTSSPVMPGFKMSDKVMHIIGYFGLMFWFAQIYWRPETVLKLAIVFMLMGVGLEFLQDLGGVRVLEVYDMVANVLGVLLAWMLVKTRFRYILLNIEKHVITRLLNE